MRTTLRAALLGLALTLSRGVLAQDAWMEVSEASINRLLQRIGVLSDAGTSQPYIVGSVPSLIEICEPVGFMECAGERIPLAFCRRVGGGVMVMPLGDPVLWQWWAKDASVKIDSGAMTFTATVRARVGDYWTDTTRTVAAAVSYDAATNAVYLEPASFAVNLALADGTPSGAPPVRVDRLFRIQLPIVPQTFSVPLPGGTTRSLSGRVLSGTPQYAPGLLRMTFNVGF